MCSTFHILVKLTRGTLRLFLISTKWKCKNFLYLHHHPHYCHNQQAGICCTIFPQLWGNLEDFLSKSSNSAFLGLSQLRPTIPPLFYRRRSVAFWEIIIPVKANLLNIIICICQMWLFVFVKIAQEAADLRQLKMGSRLRCLIFSLFLEFRKNILTEDLVVYRTMVSEFMDDVVTTSNNFKGAILCLMT